MNPDLGNVSPAASTVRTAATSSPSSEKAAAPATSSLRETVETVVFVIVLVLLLKTFVAEAFVIPTGSMATTLWAIRNGSPVRSANFGFP